MINIWEMIKGNEYKVRNVFKNLIIKTEMIMKHALFPKAKTENETTNKKKITSMRKC